MTRFVDLFVDLKCGVFSLVGKGVLGKSERKKGENFEGFAWLGGQYPTNETQETTGGRG